MDPQVKDKLIKSAFTVLKRQGKNTVEGVFMFLKERNLLDGSTEQIAKATLSGVTDPKNIDVAKFTEVVESVAKEKGFDMSNIARKVAASLFGYFSRMSGGARYSANKDDGEPESASDDSEATESSIDDEHETEED